MCGSFGPSPASMARQQSITAAADAARAKDEAAATQKANEALLKNSTPPLAPTRMVDAPVQAARDEAIRKARQTFGGANGTLLTGGSGMGGTAFGGEAKTLLGA